MMEIKVREEWRVLIGDTPSSFWIVELLVKRTSKSMTANRKGGLGVGVCPIDNSSSLREVQ
jgi:hypothetical protein